MKLLAVAATIAFILVSVGCATTPDSPSSTERARIESQNDSEINILYCWGVGGKNRLDSASGRFTRDLIVDGTKTVDLDLSVAQKRMIAQLADSIGFWQLPDKITYPDSLEIISMMQPYSDHILVIWDEHRTKAVIWDTGVQNPIAERDQVSPLGTLIRKMVTETDVYQSLPKPNGGYL